MSLRNIRSPKDSKETLFIVLLGGFIMLFVDLFMRGGIYYYFPQYRPETKIDVRDSYIPADIELHPDDLNKDSVVHNAEVIEDPNVTDEIIVAPDQESFSDKLIDDEIKLGVPLVNDTGQSAIQVQDNQHWKKFAVSYVPSKDINGKIIIIRCQPLDFY